MESQDYEQDSLLGGEPPPPSLAEQISELMSIRDLSAKALVEERKVLEQERAALTSKQVARLDVEAEVARLSAELAGLEARQIAGGCALQRCHEDIARTAAIAAGLERELQDLNASEEKLTAILAQVNDIQAQAAAAAQAARDAHSRTTAAHQLRARQAEVAKLVSETRKRQADIQAAEDRISELTQQLCDAQMSSEQLDKQIHAEQQQLSAWEMTIRRQQAQIEALSQTASQATQAPAYQLAKQDIAKMQQHEKVLEQQLAAAEQSLQEITTMHNALGCQ
jgi:chromosome segregation ATPase